MAESKESRLLSHPLVISLLMFKLRSYASACYLSQFFIHCILLFCLTFFALQVLHPNDTICQVVSQQDFNMTEILNGSETCDEPYENDTQRAQCGSCASNEKLYKYGISTLAFGVIFASFIRTMVLLFKFINYSRHLKTLWSFMTDFQNWLEVPMLILSVVFVSVFTNDCLCPMKFQWVIGIFAILFVWFDFIIFIGYLQLYISDIGIYVLMFGYMIKTFVQALFLSVPILIAFTLAFHNAFYSPGIKFSPFTGPARTIITVLSYSLGLADYNVLFALSQEGEMDNARRREYLVPFPVASTILWVLFLIIMLILLVNMLIGLAVEDIKGIKRAAEVQRLKLLVDLTLSIDSVLPYRHLFTIPEGTATSKRKGLNLWRRFNDFLWKGMIEQDSPKKIAEALVNHSEPSVDHIFTHTNSLVKEQASVREALRAVNERNQRMEADLTYIRSVLKRQFGTSPSAELELRAFPGDY